VGSVIIRKIGVSFLPRLAIETEVDEVPPPPTDLPLLLLCRC